MAYLIRSHFLRVAYVLIYLCSGLMFSKSDVNLPFIQQLQELCPYTSFCEHDAVLTLPENETRRPCCKSCSCSAGCELVSNCCFDYTPDDGSELTVKCTSPVVSRRKIPATNYIMVHSCSSANNNSICEVNDTDYRSFAPVTDFATKLIYVNADCASCNGVSLYNMKKWGIAIKCPHNKEDHTFDTLKLLDGKDVGDHGCHMVYVSPGDIYTESRECVTDAIRECNATGTSMKRDSLWDYCPMFNATYSQNINTVYGNIFCLLCNDDIAAIDEVLCEEESLRHPISSPMEFTVIIEGNEFRRMTKAINDNKFECNQTSLVSPNIKMDCSRQVCPRGKLRVGNECEYHSTQWYGGPFTAVLKLTPMKRAKIERTLIDNLPQNVMNHTKAKWLKRNAMTDWDVRTLYRPSSDGEHVDYLVVITSYPGNLVNPIILENVIRHTLNETWRIDVTDHVIPLHVQFNEHKNYSRLNKTVLESNGIFIENDFAYITTSYTMENNRDKYLFPLSMNDAEHLLDNDFVIDELFLCDQIELRPSEFEIRSSKLWINVTKQTLLDSQFRLLDSGSVSLCENRLVHNSQVSFVVQGCHIKYMLLCVWYIQFVIY